MKITAIYSHLNGYEHLMFHHKKLWKEIEQVVKSVDSQACKTKVSKEKTKVGKTLYSPIDMNNSFKERLTRKGWLPSRTAYWVTDDHKLIRKTMNMSEGDQKIEIEGAGRKPIYSYNQTDFVRERIMIEVQFGKYSFVAYDLFVKHMAFFVGDVMDVGLEIVPMKDLQEQMSSGVQYYEAALYDLIRQGRNTPAVPLVLMGLSA